MYTHVSKCKNDKREKEFSVIFMIRSILWFEVVFFSFVFLSVPWKLLLFQGRDKFD
jgi:hypothetical protein